MKQMSLEANILILMRKKFNYINEIFRITQEIGEALNRNDGYSAELLLDMRKNEMEGVDACNEEIDKLVSSLPEQDRKIFFELTKGKEENNNLNQIQEKTLELRNMIRGVLAKTIEIDKIINIKIKGA